MSACNYLLPTSVDIGEETYAIRSDFRDVLEIMKAISDPELSDSERAGVVLIIFYPDIEEMSPMLYQEAIKKCMWFLTCGRLDREKEKKRKRLIDWDKDFPMMVAPLNRILGKEIRSLEYLHWWTFKAAWDEISPDCLWAQVLKIRNKKAIGKPLDKGEQAWYRENQDLIDLEQAYTESELDFFARWSGKGEEYGEI